MNKQRVKKGFDFLSNYYDFLTTLASAGTMQRARNHFQEKILNCNSILILGSGTGQFLHSILKAGYSGEIVCLDISQKMQQKSMRRIQNLKKSRVHFILGEIIDVLNTHKFDCIVANFFLDVFSKDSLNQLFENLNDLIELECCFYFVDFVSKPGAVIDWRKVVIKPLYCLFYLICRIETTQLPEYDYFFQKYNWNLKNEKNRLFGLISSRIYRFQF